MSAAAAVETGGPSHSQSTIYLFSDVQARPPIPIAEEFARAARPDLDGARLSDAGLRAIGRGNGLASPDGSPSPAQFENLAKLPRAAKDFARMLDGARGESDHFLDFGLQPPRLGDPGPALH